MKVLNAALLIKWLGFDQHYIESDRAFFCYVWVCAHSVNKPNWRASEASETLSGVTQWKTGDQYSLDICHIVLLTHRGLCLLYS